MTHRILQFWGIAPYYGCKGVARILGGGALSGCEVTDGGICCMSEVARSAVNRAMAGFRG